jgi:predicted Zn-dependent protease
MDDVCRCQSTASAEQPLPRWEIAWRLCRALVVVAAVVIAAWGGPFRPSPRLRYQRACALLASNPVRAEILLRGLIADAAGSFPDAQLQLALRAIERGDWGELGAKCKSLDWHGADSDLLMTLGAKALDAGRWDVARLCFGVLRERDTAYAIAGLQGMARLYEIESRPDEALHCLEEITQMVPDNSHFWRLLAEARADRQHSAAAAAAYREVLRQPLRRREEADIRRRLVEQLIASGNASAARDELQRVASDDDNLAADVLALIKQLENLAACSTSDDRDTP